MLPTESTQEFRTADDLLDGRLAARLHKIDIRTRRVFAGKLQGERRSKKRGQSVEFADHRPYAIGDDLRRIDWNIYGRLDRLFMKLFMEEEDLSLHLVVDCSASMGCGEPGKLAFSQRAAMALAYVGLVNLNRVAVTAVGTDDEGGMRSVRDLRGRRRVHDAARFLGDLSAPEGESGLSFGAACKRIALSRRGRGVMVVLSDFLMREGYEDGLRMLVGRGYDVVCIQVLSPQEIDPAGTEAVGGDLRLKDVEDGLSAEVTVSAPLLERYQKTLRAYQERLRTYCARRDATFLSVPSSLEMSTLILDYLRARGVLG
ncbi:MAG: DUF58 domain-containing protein [Planctomycetota bacterium]